MLSRTVKSSKQEFDKVFLEIDHSEKLAVGNNNDLRFFMLDIQNNRYCYYNMFALLKKNLGRYALSRREFDRDPEMAISKAISRFHEVGNAGKGQAENWEKFCFIYFWKRFWKPRNCFLKWN